MNGHRGTFRLNRREAKVLGVCAGISDHFGWEPTFVRVGMALAIIVTFPLALFGYFILAMIADQGGRRRIPSEAPRRGEPSAEATRQRMRDLDARLAAIEAEVISTNTALAREIDELR